MDQIWIAVIEGIVEGLTEYLPVSSTGHMILVGELLNFKGPKAETFEVVVQLGSILAVVVLFRHRLIEMLKMLKWTELKSWRQWGQRRQLNLLHVMLGAAPALGVAFLFHDWIKEYFFSAASVLVALVAGGLLMLYAEKKQVPVTAETVDDLTYRQALAIGLFQMLALWSGFSRSGSTISGGLLVGASHKAAADFSFLMAIPIMLLASLYSVYKTFDLFTAEDIGFFAAGFVSAFVVALLAIVTFLKLLGRVKLTPFAYYRFGLALVFWLLVM
jgi:undecaprenyl-diphosphatase